MEGEPEEVLPIPDEVTPKGRAPGLDLRAD